MMDRTIVIKQKLKAYPYIYKIPYRVYNMKNKKKVKMMKQKTKTKEHDK